MLPSYHKEMHIYRKSPTFDDIRGVLLSSKHSGGKYLQITKELSNMLLLKPNVVKCQGEEDRRKPLEYRTKLKVN